jgi:hypothetical protein
MYSPASSGVVCAISRAQPPSATELPYGPCSDYKPLGLGPADNAPQGDNDVVDKELLEYLSVFLPPDPEARTAY